MPATPSPTLTPGSLGWPIQPSQWCGHSGWDPPNTLRFKCFLFLRHPFTERLSARYCLGTLPKTVVTAGRSQQRPRQCHQKAQGLEVPGRLGCWVCYQQDGMNASIWHSEPSRAHQVGTVTDWQLSHISVPYRGLQNKTRSYKLPEEKTGHT